MINKKIVLICGTIAVLGFANESNREPTAQCVFEDTKPVENVPLKEQSDWDLFVESVIYIESRGNDSAINVKENAVGCLQIRPIMVKEVNRVLKRNGMTDKYTLSDRYNREKSIEMFEIMAEQVDCCEHLTQEEFFEIVARKWNGGGRGHKRKCTIDYWNRVKNKFGSLK